MVTGLLADWLLCNRTLQLSSMSVTNSLKLLVRPRLLVELLEFKRLLQFFSFFFTKEPKNGACISRNEKWKIQKQNPIDSTLSNHHDPIKIN